MMYSRYLIFVVVLIELVISAEGYECDKSETVCETTLVVEHRMTMTHDKERKVFVFDGKIYKFNVTDPANATPLPTDSVVTADGWESERLVTVVNGSLPGPPIIVYEGQRLKVHVVNRLLSDTVAIHWHGIPQNDSPWMDGVPFVTQCPILPGQTFTYDFIAKPKGTHWYHSFSGLQNGNGLNGAFVIRERTNVMKEHIMTVQGWNHNWDSDMDNLKKKFGHYENGMKFPSSLSVDKSRFVRLYLTSVLINGRGRYYTNVTTGEHNDALLTVFAVEPGLTYRFRVINVGAGYPYRVSIDGHDLTLIASDGYDFQPITAESFIIHPGERFDFTMTASNDVSNYWVRAQTLEVTNEHKAEAILHYVGADFNEPMTSKRSCTPDSRCLVINCPFASYPLHTNTDCKRLDEFKSTANNGPAPEPESPDMFKEYFLNFAFPSRGVAAINGKEFKLPQVSALTQPYEVGSPCDKEDCHPEKSCICTHSLSISHNDVVQLVLVNMGREEGWAHPIHLHGYSFYILKMGYGKYDASTAEFISQNNDIDCQGNGDPTYSFCNNATWSDRRWHGNNVPGLELSNPLQKDTLAVPNGGYAVVRIKANNPGVWMLHNQVQLFREDGMAMILNNSYGRHPAPPKGFPVCHSYPSTYREHREDELNVKETREDCNELKTFWIVLGVVSVVYCSSMLLLVGYVLHLRKSMIPKEENQFKYVHFSKDSQQ